MVCKRCGTEFDGAFCPKCGERAEAKMTVCPVCGKERAEGENFCAKCGYAFEGQAAATQKPQAKITFDKEALIGGVRKFYKVALNIGKVFFSLLLLLILASPIMLHEGINTAGNGYTNAFNLYVDGRFTAVCAILMIIAFYSLIYGVYACVKFFVFRNREESKASKIIYFAANFLVFIVCCIGCSGAGEWFADAGAGLSFGIFVGIVGMALSVLRYMFEDKFVGSDGSQSVEVSDDVKAVEKKATKKVKLGTAVVTGALVIAVVITSIVQGVYTNPFSSASYDFAETRADVVKQFGMPENAKEDSSSYTYYSTEYATAERMIDALIAAQDKELTDGFESDADSFDEDDLESMFDGVAGIDSIIEKLKEKQDNIKYKKSVVTFNNDGGDNRSEDTVKSYVCEVVTPEVEGEEKEERTLKKFTYEGTVEDWTNIVNITYFAEYDNGSFISSSAEFVADGKNNKFNDIFGEYSININNLHKITPTLIGNSCYVKDDTLYVVKKVSKVIEYENSKSINKIFIEEGVTSIASQAFSNFTSVIEISGGNDLTYIGKDAFSATEYYKDDVNWKGGVLYIEDRCVLGIKDNVEELIVKGVLAKGAATGNTSLKKVVFGKDVTSIEDSAFEGCSALESVTFEADSKIESIGAGAFSNCSSLKAVYITDIQAWYNISFRSITSNPMYYAANLYLNGEIVTELVIPDGVTSIGDYAFYNFSSLTTITIPDSVTSIGEQAFEDCSSLTTITIPDSVTSIGGEAFDDCSSLISVTFGDNSQLESIGNSAFYYCSSLTSVKFGDNSQLESIGNSAFYYCSSLKAVYITDIEAWCNISFSNAHSNPLYYANKLYLNGDLVTELVIPESVTSIGSYAFINCDSLTSITIPNGITSIGSSAFESCSSLESVTFGENSKLESIGEYAFCDCSSLTSITIPANVTSIGSYAFYYCSSLTSITIPASVTSIGFYAFGDCSSLESVTFGENSQLESISAEAFSNCSSLTSITIPDSVTIIGQDAFAYCSSLKSITIPNSVTSIYYGAFRGCDSLASVIFENTQGWWCTDSSSATSGTNISSPDLSDPATAAKYLTDTYDNYYWTRG